MAWPTFQGALEDGFGEAVVARDMPKPCRIPFLDICRKSYLWAHKVADLALHQVVDLELYVRDVEKFPQTLGMKRMDSFLRGCKQGPCLTATQEDKGDERLLWLEHA